MAKTLCRSLFLFTLLLVFIPVSVFAQDNSDLNLSDTNDSTVVLECEDLTNFQDDSLLQNQLDDSNVLLLNDSVDETNADSELETIKSIIGDSINVGLLESQAYDYDESNKSVLNTEVENEIKKRMVENNFDYDSLGYDFAADFVRYSDFDYTGIIRIFHNSLYLDQISLFVVYLNTNEHTDDEQAYVDNFIDNNQFVFENEFPLEEYFEDGYDLEERVNSFASQYDIECASLTPYHIGGTSDFPFACFYNHKYYGKLIATFNERIKVKVPSNITNTNDYILNKVKKFFINKYNEMGISDFIDNDTEFYYSGNFVFARSSTYGYDFRVGTFVADIVNVPVVNTEPNHDESNYSNDSSNSNSNSNYNNYRRNYSYSRTYYTYYDEDSNSQTGITLGSSDTVIDISDIIKSDTKKVNTIKNSKKTNKKSSSKVNNNKTDSKDIEEKKDETTEKMSATKILFIVLAGVSLAGIVIAIINKILINSESSIDV